MSRIARSTAWNVAGTAVPALAALVAVPVLLHGLGPARFGVLAIAWAVTSYLLLFNLGLGRATTWRLVQARESHEASAEVLWTSLAAHASLGLLGGIVFVLCAPQLAGHWLNLDTGLEREALRTFIVLAFTVPVLLLTLALRSALEARERFDLINVVQIPASAFNYLGPLCVLPWTQRLDIVVLVILAGRVATLAAHGVQVWRELPAVRAPRRPSFETLGLMLGPGLWITAFGATVPLVTLLDRLAIGRLVSVEAVAWYATPYEVVSRLWIFSNSLLRALFPRLTELTMGRVEELAALHRRAVRLVLFALVPVAFGLAAVAGELLNVWVGPDMAAGAHAMQWLSVGIVASSAAAVPVTLLISSGRASWAGLVGVVEWPLYAAVTFGLTARWGATGAALAWALRAIVDAVVMFRLSGRRLGGLSVGSISLPLGQWWLLGGALAVGIWLGRVQPRAVGLVAALAGLVVLVTWLWSRVLHGADRALVSRLLRRFGFEQA